MATVVAPRAPVRAADSTWRNVGQRVVGWVGLICATALWARATVDALTIRSLIDDFEATHGPLDLSQGTLPHSSPEIEALCDDLIAADRMLFYPFSWGVLVVLALGWLCFAALAWPRRWRHRFPIAVGVAFVVLVVQVVVLAGPLGDFVLITE